MATTLTPGDILRASIWSTDAEQAAVNVLHYKVQSVGGVPATDADFATALDQTIATLYKAIINNNAFYRGVEAQIIWPPPTRVAVSATGGAGAGGSGVTSLPRQSAALTQWKTAIAGRHGRGRSYWPFPSSTANTLDGVITPATLVAIQALNVALLNFGLFTIALRTATVALIVYDRVAHTGQNVTQSVTTNKWATQRRRGTYGRANASPI